MKLSGFSSPQTAEASFARTVVLVEGISDQLALEALAARRGRNLHAEGISVVAMGAQGIGRFLDLFGPQGSTSGWQDSAMPERKATSGVLWSGPAWAPI
jgi:alpha-beta hydrolase superfamily lysophospholipase